MSTVTFAGAISLELPPPRPFPHNLLTVAEEVAGILDGEGGIDPHWRAGGTVWPYIFGPPYGEDPCVSGGSDAKESGAAIGQDDLPVFGAFTVYQPVICSTFGTRDWAELKRRANFALIAHEAFAAERQLVTGEYKSDNPYLGDANVDVLAGGPFSPREGLALLVNAIAATAQQGVIHASPGTVAAWSALGNAIYRERDGLFTTGGIPIAQGAGYAGREPDGQDGTAVGDREWAFASGPVAYRRSEDIAGLPDDVGEGLERETNELEYRAERDYLVVWDRQLQTAVLIDRSA